MWFYISGFMLVLGTEIDSRIYEAAAQAGAASMAARDTA
ncbi:hypothetical protein SBA5_590032 [Candidatus Sulfotelmatomonas gaucii]|uniref:Uncharacterized protein n=1 Tax=Candidatus Sulfuritelmatomonas gaucii TaxID=2043161 RepID=A0A2N9LVR9_9BACT|nr:hypothetical protein SBA5_590032 [Candidatus Sulfotelmatomonas gaucii]